MKTVMKKLFSLMLVAVLLVSAVPFAASADGTVPVCPEHPEATLTFNASYEQAPTCTAEGRENCYYCPGNNGHVVYDPIPALGHNYNSGVTTTQATCTSAGLKVFTCSTCNNTYDEEIAALGHDLQNGNCSRCSYTVPEDKYTVRFSVDGNDSYWYLDVAAGKTVKEPGFTYGTDYTYLNNVRDTGSRQFLGWTETKGSETADYSTNAVVTLPINNNRTFYAVYKDVAVDPPTSSRPGNITNKDNTNKVLLHIFLNGNAGNEVHYVDLMELYLMDDDTVSVAEVLRFVSDYYYTAKDSKGMEIDGLYVNTGTQGTFPQMYYTDNPIEELTGINAMRDDGHVHISVMIKNAMRKDAVKNNATADSSNPKTGDMILAPVAVLGLSASALAVLFFLNKKRAY